ncbi:acyl-CoA thioesterase domain-containing protein [Nocardia rhizosphaerihabitans]|uniref:acyl-CoA thioesterase domain-containing protein n=1 Tax=Nocardia rhizosphaerihabitans TaxID=1691570 RepID=UPI00366ACF7D
MSAEQPAAYFRRDGEAYTPTSWGRSLWADGILSGPPVCGLLAREIENRYRTGEFVPARFTVDLHQPVPAVPLTVDSELTRDGKRVRAAQAVLRAEGVVVARASAVLLKRSAQPPGEVWREVRRPPLPPAELLASVAPTVHLFDSDGSGDGWSVEISRHENDTRKRKWVRGIPVVAGEAGSPFVFAAMAGEQASLVTNWGTEGIGFINTDVSITFARLPIGPEMGIEAGNHLSHDGIAAGSAVLYDADGEFGVCTVSAVANERRQISGAAIDAYIPQRGGRQRA